MKKLTSEKNVDACNCKWYAFYNCINQTYWQLCLTTSKRFEVIAKKVKAIKSKLYFWYRWLSCSESCIGHGACFAYFFFLCCFGHFTIGLLGIRVIIAYLINSGQFIRLLQLRSRAFFLTSIFQKSFILTKPIFSAPTIPPILTLSSFAFWRKADIILWVRKNWWKTHCWAYFLKQLTLQFPERAKYLRLGRLKKQQITWRAEWAWSFFRRVK